MAWWHSQKIYMYIYLILNPNNKFIHMYNATVHQAGKHSANQGRQAAEKKIVEFSYYYIIVKNVQTLIW